MINKIDVPRLPWHDIGVRVIGDAVADLSRHFIQYWNFAKFDSDPLAEKNYLFVSNNQNSLKLLKAEEKKQEKISVKKYWEDIKQDFKDKWNKFQSTFHHDKLEENKTVESGTSSDADKFAINNLPVKKVSAKKKRKWKNL